MSEFFKRIEITIVFYTLYLTCMQIFTAIGRFTAEIIGGALEAPPPPPRAMQFQNSPG